MCVCVCVCVCISIYIYIYIYVYDNQRYSNKYMNKVYNIIKVLPGTLNCNKQTKNVMSKKTLKTVMLAFN